MIKAMMIIILTTAVIFGGKSVIKRWLHRRRMRRADRYKRRAEQKYRENFGRGMQVISRELDRLEEPEKKQNIICKNPAFAAAWR